MKLLSNIRKKCSFVKCAIVMLFVLITCTIFITVPKINANNEGEEDKNLGKSFYMMSSAAASYLSITQEPSSKGAGALKNLTIGDAGGLMSYIDSDTPGWSSFSMPSISAAATSNTYKSLLNQKTERNTGNDAFTNSMYYYARYGYLLKATGLDATGHEGGFLRKVLGIPLSLVYQIAQAVPVIFMVILNILKALNVFSLFAKGFNSAVSGYSNNGEQIDSGIIDDNGSLMKMKGPEKVARDANPLSGIGETIKNVYVQSYGWAWEIIIPICIVALLAGIFFFREDARKRTHRIKNLLIRVLLVTFGVPICGALYTQSLDLVASAVGDGMSGTSAVIASTLCDFEGWAQKARLAVPEGATLESEGSSGTLAGEPSMDTISNLKNTCYAINSFAGYNSSRFKNGSKQIDWNKAALDKSDSPDVSAQNIKDIVELINRYANGSTYESASFESEAKAWMTKQCENSEEYGKIMDEVIASSLEAKQFYHGDNSVEGDEAKSAAKERFNGCARWSKIGKGSASANLWNNGGLAAKTDSSKIGSKTFTERLSKSTELTEANLLNTSTKIIYASSPETTILKDKNKNGAAISDKGGLSTMAMYNYLNSEFSKSEIKMYSVKKSTSLFTKPSHYSVNLIGEGMLSVLYWINAMVILLSLTVIGIWYALAILVNSFKTSIEVISNVPLMVMGIIRAGVKVIIFTVVLIVELVGTMFLYTVVSDIILSIGGLTDTYVTEQLGSTTILGINASIGPVLTSSSADALKGTMTLVIIKLLISTAIIILLTVKAIQMRGKFIKGINELMQQALERLLLDGGSTGAVQGLNKPGMAGSFGKGLAEGMGKSKGMSQGKGKGHQKGPEAQPLPTNRGNYNSDDDGSIDLDKQDKEAIEEKENKKLPGPTEEGGENSGENENKLPGPSGDQSGNQLPGPSGEDGSDGGESSSFGAEGGEQDTESEDKELADKLKNANSLRDIEPMDKAYAGNTPQRDHKEDEDSSPSGPDGSSDGTDNRSVHASPEGSENSNGSKDSSVGTDGGISPQEAGSTGDEKGVKGQDTIGAEKTDSTADSSNKADPSSSKETGGSRDEKQEAKNVKGHNMVNANNKNTNVTGKGEKMARSQNGSKEQGKSHTKGIKGQNTLPSGGVNNTETGKQTAQQQKDVKSFASDVKDKIQGAAKATGQAVKNNSYKNTRIGSSVKYDKKAAQQDGIVYSRGSKSFVDANNAGKNVHAFKDVNKCFDAMNAQQKGRIKDLNGCSAKIKGNDMIITKKMANGGKTQFTVDRRSGIVKEQRYSKSYIEQRYKKEKKQSKKKK